MDKTKLLSYTSLAGIIGITSLFPTLAQASDSMMVSFISAGWDGKTVPKGQQCNRFGGKAGTPELNVSMIPAGTTTLVMEYSDQDYRDMDNGGHGKIGYTLKKGQQEVTVPSVPGHTFDLPTSFFKVAAHAAPGWDTAGAYMPPCSGGKRHRYYVTVKAMANKKVLAKSRLDMGKY